MGKPSDHNIYQIMEIIKSDCHVNIALFRLATVTKPGLTVPFTNIYSSHLAPSDYYLFLSMTNDFVGKKFTSNDFYEKHHIALCYADKAYIDRFWSANLSSTGIGLHKKEISNLGFKINYGDSLKVLKFQRYSSMSTY